jgi:hypothetical protein
MAAIPPVRPSASVPGPPFMPAASSKLDTYTRPLGWAGATNAGAGAGGCQLDGVGRTMLKTMPNVVCDQKNAAFFSQGNLDRVQALLAEELRARHGYVIDRQDDQPLLLLMRKAYLSRPQQPLEALNEAAAGEAARIVASNIRYADIHVSLKNASFDPLSYAVSDVGSIRGR